MKRVVWIMAPALVVALAAPAAFAGDHECTANTQECLDMMAQNLKNKGWIGLELDDASGQLTVKKVFAESPAEEAGLAVGDVLMAVNGIAYNEENQEKLAEIRKDMTPGKAFTFTVLKSGKEEKDLDITLGKLPEDVMAQWIGTHMLQHAKVEHAEEE